MVARLSVVVPCYRAEASVTACLDSILASGRPEVEVVAVDDCSPDGTGRLLDAYAGRDGRLRVVHLPTNGGPGNARNVGIDEARGEYLWFVDADDRLPDGAVDAVLERLRVHEPDVLIVDHAEVFGTTVVARRTVDRLGPLAGPLGLADEPRLLRLAPSACTKVVRRAVLDRTGLRFPPGRYEDAFFSPALLFAAGPIDVLDHVCYLYRQGTPGSTTTSSADWHFDVFDQYERLFTLTADDERGLRPELFRVMVDHYLVVLGHRTRVPKGRRREFFRRVVRDVKRFRPAPGYPEPGGVGRVKHALVRLGAYPPYAVFRWAFRMLPRSAPDRRGR
jgi:CDP-glycerol glycerophosphotransferase